MATKNKADLEQEIYFLLKKTYWKYENGDLVYLDVDNDGEDEIITSVYLYSGDSSYVNTLILKRENNQLYIYMENPMIQLPKNISSNEYAEDTLLVKNGVLEISSVRGNALRTSVTSTFKVVNKQLILSSQEINTYRNTDGESYSRKYDFLTGAYSEIVENILEQECRPNLTESGILDSICEGDNGYTKQKEINTQRDIKYIEFSDLCSSFYKGSKFSFQCDENKHEIKNKSYLYHLPNEMTKLYLIKGDMVNVIDKVNISEQQSFYFINYKGKKDINMWIKAEAVDLK
ncbi:hypothetical protein [Actinobacillus equuli]|uniref:hypothetical protein n=1 Tax=Actinobacillus equuli TaxID=718 RepID=UPI0024418C8D|nr:hypothetical protein [Actinobacillus equuli]WGE61372.1 hypothetical protein NYR74_00900 [Actinobacillus equuli subsp. haemolyticus]